jgi:prolipoprotein diacylglyceryltransferase
MINEVEKKKRRIRWWFNMCSSALIFLIGLLFLIMRYVYDYDPMQDRFWMITGLLLGYGLFRLILYFWRGKHLFDDIEDQ